MGCLSLPCINLGASPRGSGLNVLAAMQVRVFSSREHTRALSASDVWAVVGWSGDIIPLAERINDVVLVAPASGTALWADMWAVPSQACNGSQVIKSPPQSLPLFPMPEAARLGLADSTEVCLCMRTGQGRSKLHFQCTDTQIRAVRCRR